MDRRDNVEKQYPSAAQAWLNTIPVMQQSVLFSGIRGMDGLQKLHPAKMLVRFYRRCVLISAFDGKALENPYDPGGGDFTGPSIQVIDGKISMRNPKSDSPMGYIETTTDNWPAAMQPVADDFVRARDEMPLHYFSHMMHAFQIVGVHHPNMVVRSFWWNVYVRMAHSLHLYVEPPQDMNTRLGDTEAGWRDREDAAGSCST